MFENASNFLKDSNPRIEIKLKNYNEVIVAELFPEQAPITVENFLSLIKDNFYSDIIFHRVIKGFMIQGGDPTGTGMSGSDNKIKGEFAQNGVNNPVKHNRGVLSMARTMVPDSASSQIFIMHQDSPHLDGAYAAFGTVVSGIEIVDKVAETKVGHGDKPLEDQVIEYIKVL